MSTNIRISKETNGRSNVETEYKLQKKQYKYNILKNMTPKEYEKNFFE